MPKLKSITDAVAKRLKQPVTGQTDYFDQTYPGLHLRVGARLKTWGHFYRIGGRLRRITFGSYPEMSVEAAHEAWRQARDTTRGGIDPAQRPEGVATDFAGVFEEWMRRDQAKNRSAPRVRRRIERYALPLWQHRQIDSIGRRDVLNAIDAIEDSGHVVLARRVHAHLHRLFKWAVGRGIITVNPLADLPKPGSETARDRVLSDAELVAVWNAAEPFWPWREALKLLILTGARRTEILHLRWSEIEGDTIRLEGSRTKNGAAHLIPLSRPALTILENMPRIAGSDWVFSTTGRRPPATWSRVKKSVDEAVRIAPWRTHDLRRTTATGLQKLRTPLQVTEAVLGHTGGSRAGVVGIYQRHDYAAEKRAALEAWGAHVMALIEGREPAKVLPMRGRQP